MRSVYDYIKCHFDHDHILRSGGQAKSFVSRAQPTLYFPVQNIYVIRVITLQATKNAMKGLQSYHKAVKI